MAQSIATKDSKKRQLLKFYEEEESFNNYATTNVKRVGELKKIYSENKVHFGNRVLDLGCGGGILAFIAKPKVYFGVDLNPKSIRLAREQTRNADKQYRFVMGDITRLEKLGSFDTVALLGNTLGHINTLEFREVLDGVGKNVAHGANFIIEYRDTVDLLFNKRWKAVIDVTFADGRRGKSLTRTYNTFTGEIMKADVFGTHTLLRVTQAVWAPFILEQIMLCSGWKLIKRNRSRRWDGWFEIYRLEARRQKPKSIFLHQ